MKEESLSDKIWIAEGEDTYILIEDVEKAVKRLKEEINKGLIREPDKQYIYNIITEIFGDKLTK